jgi:ATP-binding cassette subfamily B protein
MLFVSHNIRETTRFQRVLVFANGRIIEDGAPQELLGRPCSQYRRMLEKETSLLSHLRDSPQWQHTHLEKGEVVQV